MVRDSVFVKWLHAVNEVVMLPVLDDTNMGAGTTAGKFVRSLLVFDRRTKEKVDKRPLLSTKVFVSGYFSFFMARPQVRGWLMEQCAHQYPCQDHAIFNYTCKSNTYNCKK